MCYIEDVIEKDPHAEERRKIMTEVTKIETVTTFVAAPDGDELIAMLAHEGHGAVEVDEPIGKPLFVVLAGPLKWWWGKNADGTARWESPEHLEYIEWRDAVRVAIVKAGHLTYSPHRAWQGAWHEGAQAVNDAAIKNADAIVVMTPPGVEANGTNKEREVAAEAGVVEISASPGNFEDLQSILARLRSIQVDKEEREN